MGKHVAVPGGRRILFEKSDIKDDVEEAIAWSDGSCYRGLLGGGFVLQSIGEKVIEKAVALYPVGLRDSTAAELLSLVSLLETALAEGVTRLSVGLDSFEALNHLERVAVGKPSSYPQEVESCRRLAAEFETLELLNIANKKNARADGLSRKALGLRPR